MLLETAGYGVVEAVDGADGLAQLTAASATIVLVILDLAMPGTTGWQFRERQLADPRLAKIPTIVLSGVTLMRSEVERLGVRAALSKPFLFADLLRFVRAYASSPA